MGRESWIQDACSEGGGLLEGAQYPGHSASWSHRAVEQPLSIHCHVVTQLGTLDGDHTEPHRDQVEVG